MRVRPWKAYRGHFVEFGERGRTDMSGGTAQRKEEERSKYTNEYELNQNQSSHGKSDVLIKVYFIILRTPNSCAFKDEYGNADV